jgi:hypothetical protein
MRRNIPEGLRLEHQFASLGVIRFEKRIRALTIIFAMAIQPPVGFVSRLDGADLYQDI